MCLCMTVCALATHVRIPMEASRRQHTSWSWSYRVSRSQKRVLGTKPGSSRKSSKGSSPLSCLSRFKTGFCFVLLVFVK